MSTRTTIQSSLLPNSEESESEVSEPPIPLIYAEKCTKVIDQVRLFEYTPVNECLCGSLNVTEMSTCSICYTPLSSLRVPIKLGCGHIFHQKCLEDWRRCQNVCPICRAPVELRSMFNPLQCNVFAISRMIYSRLNPSKGDPLEESEFIPPSFMIQKQFHSASAEFSINLVWVNEYQTLSLHSDHPPPLYDSLRHLPFIQRMASPSDSPAGHTFFSYPGGGRLSDILAYLREEQCIADIHRSVGVCIGMVLCKACSIIESLPREDPSSSSSHLPNHRIVRIDADDIYVSEEVCHWLCGCYILPPHLIEAIRDGSDQRGIFVMPKVVSVSGPTTRESSHVDYIELYNSILSICKSLNVDTSSITVPSSPTKPSDHTDVMSPPFTLSRILSFFTSLFPSTLSRGHIETALDNRLARFPDESTIEEAQRAAPTTQTNNEMYMEPGITDEHAFSIMMKANGYFLGPKEKLTFSNMIGPRHRVSDAGPTPKLHAGDSSFVQFLKRMIYSPFVNGYVHRTVKDTLIEYIMSSFIFIPLGIFFLSLILGEIHLNPQWNYPPIHGYSSDIVEKCVNNRKWLWILGLIFCAIGLSSTIYKKYIHIDQWHSIFQILMFIFDKAIWIIGLIFGWMGSLGMAFLNSQKNGNIFFSSFLGPIRMALQCILDMIEISLVALFIHLKKKDSFSILMPYAIHVALAYLSYSIMWHFLVPAMSSQDNWDAWYYYYASFCIHWFSPLIESSFNTLARWQRDHTGQVLVESMSHTSILFNMSAVCYYYFVGLDAIVILSLGPALGSAVLFSPCIIAWLCKASDTASTIEADPFSAYQV
ncbi:hypothetical protein ADUPG1_013819 [Aduncisulcus paluster]|uniref:RING-type domain-containing protein n=1 Tax=Aduncisulcus paluster TaxID=2918883 RepID=A0ABQ5K8B2_9EUKA|nr:hypothetical protein ADUPG1_013819 [Aduncisulcus paluster]